MRILGLILLGLVSGVASGMLGIGGGLLIVPALVFFLKVPIHIAAGTSLVAIIPTAISGALAHARQGNVDLGLSVWIMVGAVAGGAMGATAAEMLPELAIKRVFAVLLGFVAVRMFLGK